MFHRTLKKLHLNRFSKYLFPTFLFCPAYLHFTSLCLRLLACLDPLWPPLTTIKWPPGRIYSFAVIYLLKQKMIIHMTNRFANNSCPCKQCFGSVSFWCGSGSGSPLPGWWIRIRVRFWIRIRIRPKIEQIQIFFFLIFSV